MAASMGPRLISRGNELWQRLRLEFVDTGFNGAATDQSRKSHAPTLIAGRRFSASMGPRLISRGNGGRISGNGRGHRGFNGAATDQSRKSSASLHELCDDHAASMGPRLISRGNKQMAAQ